MVPISNSAFDASWYTSSDMTQDYSNIVSSLSIDCGIQPSIGGQLDAVHVFYTFWAPLYTAHSAWTSLTTTTSHTIQYKLYTMSQKTQTSTINKCKKLLFYNNVRPIAKWHIKQQKYFHYIKGRAAADIIHDPYYISGPWGDENILLFYMCHFAMGLTHCYKTGVFLHLYLQFFY